jgi:hypothetical protein
MIMLACAAAVVSMSLTAGFWALEAIAEARVASASTTATGVLAGHDVLASAWRGMREQLREPAVQEFVSWPLQLALLSLLLPVFGWLRIASLEANPA